MIPIDDVVVIDCITSTPATSAAVDADSAPTFDVFEEDTDTPILAAQTMTKRTSKTGNYRGSITASAANGFEAGKWYSVTASGIVGGVTGKSVISRFRVAPAETSAGVPQVRSSAIADGAIAAATLASDTITAAKVADGAIDAATFAAGAINAAAIATDAITAAKIADGAIDAATFAAGAINAAAIASDAITDAKVASDVTIASVTGAVGSVTGAVGSVTGAVGSVTGAVGSVTGNVGGNVTGSVGSVATGGIAAASFAAGAINAAAIATDAITSSKVADGFLTAAKFASGAFDAVWSVTTRTLSSFGSLVSDTATAVWAAGTRTLTAASDSSGITTLLGKLAGITLLAEWLGLIAGKQTGNSTARTEVRATGAGSGTYDETTDSQEAARDNMGTAQTGDAFARLGVPAGASVSADIADLPTNAELATALGTADDAVLAAIAALNNLSQANIRTAVGLGSANLDTQLADLPTNAELATALAAADDAVLAAIAALNNLSAAQVNAEADAALVDIHLDHLLAVTYDPASKPGAADALLNELVESDAGIARYTANALEQAPTGGSAPTVGQIADAVWDELIAGHAGVGSTGEALSDAGGAGTPPTVGEIADAVWDEATAGHTTGGTFGEQAKTDIDTIVTATAAGAIRSAVGLASANLDTQLTAIDDLIDTEVGAIKAKTDQFVFTVANQVDANALSGGGSGLDAAGVRSAVGLASANLDTQIGAKATQTSVDDLPTNAELATALGTADDAVLAQVALVKAKTDNLPADPADASDIAAAFSTVNTKLDTIDDFLDTEIAAIVAALTGVTVEPTTIAAQTASLAAKINSLYQLAITEQTQASDGSRVVKKSTGATVGTATNSDVLGTFTRGLLS